MPHRRPAPLCRCRGQILGLQQGKDYSDPAAYRGLRYGHLMIMTDQDHDGSHIKGLVINFLHCYWPALLQKRATPARVAARRPTPAPEPRCGTGVGTTFCASS